MYGSIEAGGTKFICAVGNENMEIIESISIPTTTPDETLKEVINYFKKYNIKGLGIASFGPIDVNPKSNTYGYITTTPKKGWENFDLLGILNSEFDIPMTFTTDVNASAYGEFIALKEKGDNINSLVYYTVGTGVGGGMIYNGEVMTGFSHAEMGHTLLKRHKDDLNYKGNCPYHSDCLEGLVAGPTFQGRLDMKGEDVEHTHEVWDILAYYLAQAAMQVTLITRPEKIIFGGSVVNETLLRKIKEETIKINNNYVELPNIDEYISLPIIAGNGSATIGNFALVIDKINKA